MGKEAKLSVISIVSLIALIALFLLVLLSGPAYAKSNMLVIKFHALGDGKNVTIDLSKYLPLGLEYIHTPVQNVSVIIKGNFATILPNEGWIGNEVVTFSTNRTLIEEVSEGLIEGEEITNLEPIVEMSFPPAKQFGVSPGQMEFTVVVYDPDNDMLTVDWLVNGVSMKTERSKGGIISHFMFNKTATEKLSSILKGHEYTEKTDYFVVNSIINDSKNQKMLEWRFNMVDQACTDFWKCENWSECIGGKRYRQCSRINPKCESTGNKPATEWLDPVCISEPAGCVPEWKCGNWSECSIDYDVGLITFGRFVEAIKTRQQRLCYDSVYCSGATGLENRECEKDVPVTTREVIWCDQQYIEIFKKETGQFLSRIKKYSLGNPSMDIDLSLRELEQEDYCWYCYNGIKDYDEIDVDCGGSSCAECITISAGINFVDILKLPLFLLADLLLVVYIIAWIKNK